jgi:hypothetical protein
MLLVFILGYQIGLWEKGYKSQIRDNTLTMCSRTLSLVGMTLRSCKYNLMVYTNIRPGEHAEVCRQCHSQDATYTSIPMTHADHTFQPILF